MKILLFSICLRKNNFSFFHDFFKTRKKVHHEKFFLENFACLLKKVTVFANCKNFQHTFCALDTKLKHFLHLVKKFATCELIFAHMVEINILFVEKQDFYKQISNYHSKN